MPGYDTWEDERERLLNGVREDDDGQVAKLLDSAAESARKSGLREAAHWMEELRRVMVGRRLFQGWDDGILCFSSLIRIVRRMSAEAVEPPEYRRLLDGIPDLHFDTPMTPSQKLFWYGGVPDQAPAAGRKGCLFLFAAFLGI